MDRRRHRLTLSVPGTAAAAVIPAAFLAVFFLWPVANIVWRGLAPDGRPDVAAAVDILGTDRVWRVAWFTTWQAVVSVAVTLMVGLPIAGTLARFRIPGTRLIRAITTVPFVMPTVVVATAFIAILDSMGGVGEVLRDNPASIIAAHVFFNIAVVVRTVTDPWARLDRGPEEAARLLGSSVTRTFLTITIPRLRLAIGAAASIVFLFTFTSFGVVLLLGGPSRTTLEVETFIQTSLLNLDRAAVLALLQVVIVVIVLVTQRRLSERLTLGQRQVGSNDQRLAVDSTARRALVGSVLGIGGVIVTAPLLVLVWRSVRRDGAFTLGHYRALDDTTTAMLATPVEAMWNSVSIGLVAMMISVVVGSLAAVTIGYGNRAVTRRLDTALMLPLGTSAATLGFGFLIALDSPPLDLRTSVWLVPLAHALIGVPFVIRLLVPTIAAIDDRLRSTALMLGQSPWQTWLRVDLPMLSRAVVASAGFAFAVSLGEFGATSFIVRPDRPTLPTAVGRYLARPGEANVGQAMAMATILMAVTVAAVALIESFRVREAGDF